MEPGDLSFDKGFAALNEGFTRSEALNKRHAPPPGNTNFQCPVVLTKPSVRQYNCPLGLPAPG